MRFRLILGVGANRNLQRAGRPLQEGRLLAAQKDGRVRGQSALASVRRSSHRAQRWAMPILGHQQVRTIQAKLLQVLMHLKYEKKMSNVLRKKNFKVSNNSAHSIDTRKIPNGTMRTMRAQWCESILLYTYNSIRLLSINQHSFSSSVLFVTFLFSSTIIVKF